jgi:hypothetical protein
VPPATHRVAPETGAPEGPPWENTKSVGQLGLDGFRARRREAWDRRQVHQRFLDHQAALAGSWDGIAGARFAKCGRCVCSDFVTLRATFGEQGPVAYSDGVVLCGSVWACPVCGRKIRFRRSQEVELAAVRWSLAGGSLVMVTDTIRHQRADPLADSLAILKSAHRRLLNDRRWKSLRAGPLAHLIVATEITWGSNGWHPHIHDLLFVRPGFDPAEVVAGIEAWLPKSWPNIVERVGGRRPNLRYGVRAQAIEADAASYIAKIAKEATRADLKGDSRSPFALLDAMADGEAPAIAMWSEYVTATKGVRAIVMSRGLRAALLADVEEKSDEELAAEVVDGQVLEVVPGVTWQQWCRLRNEHGVVEALARLEAWERTLQGGTDGS